MKSPILFAFVLIVNISLSQEKKDDLHHKIFKNSENSHYSIINNDVPEISEEIKLIELIEPMNNSEGKFPLYQFNNTRLINDFIVTNSLEIKESSNEKSKVIFTKDQIVFINNLIDKKQLNIAKLDSETNKQDNYTRIVLHRYIDLLNASYHLNSRVKIQVGKNLNAYLKKLHKSEIDKTLQNSLNLLAISF